LVLVSDKNTVDMEMEQKKGRERETRDMGCASLVAGIR
jgi:hypothetical protein